VLSSSCTDDVDAVHRQARATANPLQPKTLACFAWLSDVAGVALHVLTAWAVPGGPGAPQDTAVHEEYRARNSRTMTPEDIGSSPGCLTWRIVRTAC
jgi:hypothetical protein